MTQIDVSEARKSLPGLIRRIEAGEEDFQITRYGKVVALLTRPGSEEHTPGDRTPRGQRGPVDAEGNVMAKPPGWQARNPGQAGRDRILKQPKG